MAAHPHGAGVLRLESVFHDLVPEPANGPEPGHLFEEIARRRPEERQAVRNRVHVVSAAHHLCEGRDAVGHGDGHFRNPGCPEFPQVVTVEGDEIPLGYILPDKFDVVALNPEAVPRRDKFRAAADQLLQRGVVLDAAAQLFPGDAPFSARARNMGKRIAVLDG